MKVKCTTRWLPLLAAIAAVVGCSSGVGSYTAPRQSPAAATPATESKSHQSPVRSIDFANFTYPAKPVYSNGTVSFTLSNGKYEGENDRAPVYLSYLVYGDVTGEGQEEALVTLVLSVKGTAIPLVNYIYGLADGKPKLLWAFQNGDRADDGLRQIYGENGQLVVERLSPIGKNGAFATQFTRTRYKWLGNRFEQQGTSEILPNPSNNSSPVMTPYRRS